MLLISSKDNLRGVTWFCYAAVEWARCLLDLASWAWPIQSRWPWLKKCFAIRANSTESEDWLPRMEHPMPISIPFPIETASPSEVLWRGTNCPSTEGKVTNAWRGYAYYWRAYSMSYWRIGPVRFGLLTWTNSIVLNKQHWFTVFPGFSRGLRSKSTRV